MSAFERSILVVWTGMLLLCAGCIGPHYTRYQLILFGKAPPAITGPHDPMIEKNLSTRPWPTIHFHTRFANIGNVWFKSMGIRGWKDFHLNAKARGAVIQHATSSGGFLTVDMLLDSLTADGVPIHFRGKRYMRLEIFLPQVPVDLRIFDQPDLRVVARGKLVWDSDGWFEIHPQKPGDVEPEPEKKGTGMR